MYQPKHMREKGELRTCACGHRPVLQRVTCGHDVVYRVKCPTCEARTWGKLTEWGARTAWNSGELAWPAR